jgi:hypothetical protein
MDRSFAQSNGQNIQRGGTATMPALSQALAAEAAELSENVNAREVALRYKLLQRIFR